MITFSHPTKKHLVFNIQKITSKNQLWVAILHNKREIAREIGTLGHIDASRTHLNYSLVEFESSDRLREKVNQAIAEHQKFLGKRIRHDAVIALEVLFSISSQNTEINRKQYFEDCLAWSVKEFLPAQALTADVHLDESSPHLHIIFLCVTKTNLVASAVTGFKKKFSTRRENFQINVGSKHGLVLPPPALSRKNRGLLAKQVIKGLELSQDPITHSKHYAAICEAIHKNPAPFAFEQDLEAVHVPQKMRTMAQIFTSKGRGSNDQRHR
jgi:hypothetical protein